ncbi:MAG: hypothetical protein Q9O24_08305 [Gammaproteobacteria bacterium]|nr:hypothetical protein [Gammaproteobacteria bacterium]
MNKKWQMSLPVLSALVLAACGGGGGSTPVDTGLLKNVPETYSINIPKSLLSNGTVKSLRVADGTTPVVVNPSPTVAAPVSFGYQRLQAFARNMKARQAQIADQFVLVDKLWDSLVAECQLTVVDDVCSVAKGTFELTYTQTMADAVYAALEAKILDDDDLSKAEVDAALLAARDRANGVGANSAWPKVGSLIAIDNEFEFTTLTTALATDYLYRLKMVAAPLNYVVVLPASTPAADAAGNGASDAGAGAGAGAGGTTVQLRDFAENEVADFTLQWSEDESRVSLLEEINKGSEIESFQYTFIADAVNGDSMTVTGSKEETEKDKTELKESLLTIKEVPSETAISGVELSFSENESKTKTKNGAVISKSEAATVEGRADDTGGFVRSMQQDDEEGLSSVEHRKEEFDANGGLLLATFCRDEDINDANGDSCFDTNGVAVDTNWQIHDPNGVGVFARELDDDALDAAANAATSRLVKVAVSGLPVVTPVAPLKEVKTRFELYVGDPNDANVVSEQVGEGKQEVKADGRVKVKVRYWGTQAQLDAGVAVYEMSYDALTGTTTRVLIAGAAVMVAAL